MKLVLKDFQESAVDDMYSRVVDARKRASKGQLEVLTLSAPTGSGKTVILTRLIELVLEGDEAHNPDPDATFLWLTDQPELNTQTRDKMRATSDLLVWSRTLEIGADFDHEVFPPGVVYFLNTQKLGTGTNWVKTGDSRTFTLWDTIRNTATARPGRFAVIIDEAHRGTKLDGANANEANSIMQKFVLGSDEIPPVPLIIGISATLDRFTELLEAAAKAKKSRTHQRVDVDPVDVIASGLLKRKVVLHHPEKTLAAEFPLLREAVRVWRDMDQRWAAYCASQQEPHVVTPILVIQVEDGTKTRISNTELEAVVAAVRDEAGNLPAWAFAHAFEGGASLVLDDGTTLRHLAPSAINADPDIKVVLFKTSLNTGWDCPRAEVMMSFRTAKDATFIAQLVGRMVRAPLAREIDEDEILNSVTLMLPRFDASELARVLERLTDIRGDVPPTTIEDAKNRAVLNRAVGLDDCFAALAGLPTYLIPRRKAIGDVQRLGQLADALSQSGLRGKAGSEARDGLVEILETEYATRKDAVAYKAVVKEDGKIPVTQVVLDYGSPGGDHGKDTRAVPVSEEMVTELYEWARKRLGLDLGLRYWKRRADKDKSENHILTKLELFALASDPDVLDRLRQVATDMTVAWLSEYKAAIKKLPEGERKRFDEVKQQVGKPTLDELDISNRLTLDWSVPAGASMWSGHLFQNGKGQFPERLNTWETAAINEELGRSGFAAWLRNKEKQPWALCVPYQMAGVWKGCYPDFIVCRRQGGDVVIDIIDPHLTSVEDAPAKAAALATYADDHQDHFGRIDLIIVDKQGTSDERVKRLSLMSEKVRKKVRGVTTNQHLRDLFDYEG